MREEVICEVSNSCEFPEKFFTRPVLTVDFDVGYRGDEDPREIFWKSGMGIKLSRVYRRLLSSGWRIGVRLEILVYYKVYPKFREVQVSGISWARTCSSKSRDVNAT